MGINQRMSSVVALAVAAVFLIAACSPEAGEAPTGPQVEAAASAFDAAPDFELELFGNEKNAKGEVLRLSQFKGQPVVVNFWYPSCPPCRLEMPHFEAASKEHREVQFVGVQLLGLDTARRRTGLYRRERRHLCRWARPRREHCRGLQGHRVPYHRFPQPGPPDCPHLGRRPQRKQAQRDNSARALRLTPLAAQPVPGR